MTGSVPNGGAAQGQVWTDAQWITAWQSKADDQSAVAAAATLTGAEPVVVTQGVTNVRTTVAALASVGTYTPPGTGAVSTTVSVELARQWISPEDYGAVGDGVTDDTAALTAWINVLIAGPNRFGKMQDKTYCISAPLPQINVSGVWILGCGSDDYHNSGNSGTAQTFIKWIGTSNAGSMLVIAPTNGAATYLVGNRLIGVSFKCQSLIAYGVQLLSIRGGEFEYRCQDATASGSLHGCVATLTGDPCDFQINKIRYKGSQTLSAAPCLTITGTTTANCSLNTYEIIDCVYFNAPAVQWLNSDTNIYQMVRLFYAATGAATTSAVFAASNTNVSLTARDELFLYFYGGQAPTIQTGTFPAGGIRFLNLNLGNGAQPPVCQGDGRQASWENDNTVNTGAWQAFTPVVTPGAGAFGVTPPTAVGRFIVNNNMVTFNITITFAAATSVGTASGWINCTIPYVLAAAAQATSFTGYESAVTGQSLIATVGPTSNVCRIFKNDGITFFAANSYQLNINGSFEIQSVIT